MPPAARRALLRLLAAFTLAPAPVAAQVQSPRGAAPLRVEAPPPGTRKFQYSRYEEATVHSALASLGLVRDPSPEGKRIEGIDTVRLEVIEERDPAPRFLNVFHSVTRSYVVDREVLLRPGDAYRETLADETQRNLAAIEQFSLVLLVAARGGEPGTVRVVVVTKDVWSLRLNWDITLTTNGLESLSVNPSETNLLGTHQTVGAAFKWLPASHSFGVQYAIPRVGESHVAVVADAGIVLGNGTGRAEGSFGDLSVTVPLWSSRTEWSWGVAGSWLNETSRLYSEGRIAAFALDPGTSCAATPALCVPWVYRTETRAASAFVTRSFGWAVKQDVSVGWEVSAARYAVPDLGAFDPATARAFVETRVPRSEDRVNPFLQVRVYRSDFLRVLDLETLALQEDYRVGPQASVRFYPVLAALGSTRTLYGVTAGVSYLAPLGDGLARAAVDATNEIESSSGAVKNGSVRAALRVATPRFTVGRIVVDGVVLDRYANDLNRLTGLGGNNRLRGYPTQAFVGQHFAATNVELRTRAHPILDTVQVGAVAFWDAGNAFDRWSEFRLWHSVGAGVRVLFPQLDRVVFRADAAVPLSRPLPAGATPVGFFATFGQAF